MNIYKISLLLLIVSFTSCSEFLDEAPDNRTAIDSQDKVRKLLTSAYPEASFALVTEFGTDNIVDEGEDNPKSSQEYEEMAYWKDLTISFDDDTKTAWEAHYSAIASANLALQSIENGIEGDLKAEKAEALMARAYSHFMLVNVFSKHYNPDTADTDLGVVYMEGPEVKLNPKYKRESVKAIYEKINADIEAALPNISDDIYEQPKYHFNRKASYAFAARFNLYYGKWTKAKEYADVALVSSSLIDFTHLSAKVDKHGIRAKEYIQYDGVFLDLTSGGSGSVVYGPYYESARINHTAFVSSKETVEADMPWGSLWKGSYTAQPTMLSGANFDKVNFPKIPYMFEVTDPVAGIGHNRTVYTAFTADETFLIRAEAKVHLQEYASALEDLNRFTANFFNGEVTTIADIDDFYNNMSYSGITEADINQKKKLNPVGFSVIDVAQENMFHYVLQCRRIFTLHEGLRWYDIKRFGIEVNRFKEVNGPYELQDQLTVGDNRRAIQIPSDVVSSGIASNPR